MHSLSRSRPTFTTCRLTPTLPLTALNMCALCVGSPLRTAGRPPRWSPPSTLRSDLAPPVPGGILPFRQFVLKVHSRCDLACDHCYVYEHADQSWRARPKVIAADTVALAGDRIADHAR